LNKHTKLTKPERVLLSQWKNEGLSNIDCAKRLGRDKSTIGRELNRNKTQVWITKANEYIYEPNHAQLVTDQRKQKAFNAKQPLKSKKIYGYVMEHLRGGWSPEGIAGRLRKEDHPEDSSWWICHETIYAFIYKEKTDLTKQGLISQSLLDQRLVTHNQAVTITDFDRPLYEYLRRKQTKRRKKSGRKVHRSHIPDRVSIHLRPAVINQRTEFGHWEGDTVEGIGHKNGIHTEVERVSRLIGAKYVKAIDSQSALDAQLNIFTLLPKKARISTTLDNGRETHLHFKLRNGLDMQTFHADPYSSWQRGTNENGNGLIRCYFPKGTDFAKVTDQELEDVIWELNNRPRKILQYKTAQEVFDLHLNLL
jgi:IS30 family transposase